MELKKVQDYYEELFKLYPDIPKRDIQRIMQYGLKSFLMQNNYGGDAGMKKKAFPLVETLFASSIFSIAAE